MPNNTGRSRAAFPHGCISAQFPAHNVALKGLAIRAGNGASVLFDTEFLRMAAGWTGGYITTRGVVFDGEHENRLSPKEVASSKGDLQNLSWFPGLRADFGPHFGAVTES